MSLGASATTRPGWYPDPLRQSAHRYWDGGQWTGYIHPAGLGTASSDTGAATATSVLSVTTATAGAAPRSTGGTLIELRPRAREAAPAAPHTAAATTATTATTATIHAAGPAPRDAAASADTASTAALPAAIAGMPDPAAIDPILQAIAHPDPIVVAPVDALQRRPVLIYDQRTGTRPAYTLAVAIPLLAALLGIAAIVTPTELVTALGAADAASFATPLLIGTIGFALLLAILSWALVVRDRAQLRERGFLPQSWAWLFLGPFWYFVARWAVLARQSGERAGRPLWAHVVVHLLLAAGIGAAVWFLAYGDTTALAGWYPAPLRDAVRDYLAR